MLSGGTFCQEAVFFGFRLFIHNAIELTHFDTKGILDILV